MGVTCPHGTVIPLWVPGANATATYFELACNAGHDPIYEMCSYTDPRSGSRVEARFAPAVVVDARGCVSG